MSSSSYNQVIIEIEKEKRLLPLATERKILPLMNGTYRNQQGRGKRSIDLSLLKLLAVSHLPFSLIFFFRPFS
jgi:hypothetical protein